MANDQRPIIIKKIKKGGGHGHHGGAWKVAYADFVTAMMAFFLLLWLLSSVEEGKLESLADYFTPTIGVKDSMGIGFEGGTTANIDGTKKSDRSPPGVIVGIDVSGPTQQKPDHKALIESDKDAQLFEKAEESMKRAFADDPNLRDLADNIIVEQNPEGLKIEITDSDRFPMFQPGNATLSDFGKRILKKMSAIIELMPNFVSITGHTDYSPLNARGGTYTNWELSLDRANSARRYLLSVGMEPERPKAITGKAATELLLPLQPLSPRNRRITVILLRGDYMSLKPQALPATRELLSVPRVQKRTNQKLDDLRKSEAVKPAGDAPQTPSLPGQQPDRMLDDPLGALLGEDGAAPESPITKPQPSIDDFQEFLE